MSGDGSYAAFHSNIRYQEGDVEASATAWETYLWRKSDNGIHKVSDLKGKECNRTASFERLVELYGLANLTAQNLAEESKLASGGAQCEAFALAGEHPGRGAGEAATVRRPVSNHVRSSQMLLQLDCARHHRREGQCGQYLGRRALRRFPLCVRVGDDAGHARALCTRSVRSLLDALGASGSNCRHVRFEVELLFV